MKTLPTTDVTVREIRDLRRKLTKMLPEGHHYRRSMTQVAKGKKQKANEART